jgi:hypothetical protein
MTPSESQTVTAPGNSCTHANELLVSIHCLRCPQRVVSTKALIATLFGCKPTGMVV